LDWRLERHLPDHEVESVPLIGWAGVENGELLERARSRFDIFMTMDRGSVEGSGKMKAALRCVG
jgi:hypothetical protein